MLANLTLHRFWMTYAPPGMLVAATVVALALLGIAILKLPRRRP